MVDKDPGIGVTRRGFVVLAAAGVAGCTRGDDSSSGNESSLTGQKSGAGDSNDSSGAASTQTSAPSESPTASPAYTQRPFDGIQTSKLTANDGAIEDTFGASVDLSGNGRVALVGAPTTGWNEGETSSVYVFERSNGSWRQRSVLSSDSLEARDGFGYTVALSADGTIALVGADRDVTVKGEETGSVYVFERSGGDWRKRKKLIASDGDADDGFGASVDLTGDGSRILVGAPSDENPNGLANGPGGSAYVFERSGKDWTQQTKIAPNNDDRVAYFGRSVTFALDGRTALIGSSGIVESTENGNYPGSAFVYRRSGGSWEQQSKLTADDSHFSNGFGTSVSLSRNGNTALIGAVINNNENGEDAGAAYVFERSGDSWQQNKKLIASDGSRRDRFGKEVALNGDGNRAFVSSSMDEEYTGSAYMFETAAGDWKQVKKLTAEDGDHSDNFGFSLACSVDGGTVLIGARTDEDPHGENAGSAYIFE